jgi:hypothetical protein
LNLLCSRRLTEFSIAVAIALSVAWVFGLDQNIWVLNAIYFSSYLLVIQIFYLMGRDRNIKRELKRKARLPFVTASHRRNLIYLGGILVLFTASMDHIPGIGKVIPSFGNLFLTAYLFLMSQAI